MDSTNGNPLTKHEFDEWATATKETLNAIEGTLGEHTTLLEQIAKGISDMVKEQRAMTSLYRRLDHRDHVFAKKLKLDLRKVDAEV